MAWRTRYNDGSSKIIKEVNTGKHFKSQINYNVISNDRRECCESRKNYLDGLS